MVINTMKKHPYIEPEKQLTEIESLTAENQKLRDKVQRLQDARLAKYASMAMSGLLANPNTVILDTNGKPLFKGVAIWSIKQAKALIAALNDEKED